jgi:AcrR family transcriptional regulator
MFWESGYEGVGVNQLSRRLGITKSSFYAAFGSKELLFSRVLERYTSGPASYGLRALEQPSARSVFSALLNGAVLTNTTPGAPRGCLGVQGALPHSTNARPAHDVLVAWRNAAVDQLERRLQRAADEGDLPPHADPKSLALYMTTITFGIAVQAASGIGRTELQKIADIAVENWRPY